MKNNTKKNDKTTFFDENILKNNKFDKSYSLLENSYISFCTEKVENESEINDNSFLNDMMEAKKHENELFEKYNEEVFKMKEILRKFPEENYEEKIKELKKIKSNLKKKKRIFNIISKLFSIIF